MRPLLLALLILGTVWAKAQGPDLKWVTADPVWVNQAIATDNKGNTYTTGIFSGRVDFDPGPDSFMVSATPEHTTFVLKTDREGKFAWVRILNSAQNTSAADIVVDAAGNIVLTGMHQDPAYADDGAGSFGFLPVMAHKDIYIWKLKPDGRLIWVKLLGTDIDEEPYTITATADTGILITGRLPRSMDIDPDYSSTVILNNLGLGGGNLFIVKLDAAGAYQWASAIGGTKTNILARDMTTDRAGNIYITGNYSGTIDTTSGLGGFSISAGAYIDIFLLKLNDTGRLLWAKSFDGTGQNWSNGVCVDTSGYVYLAGCFCDTTDFDPGPGTHTLTTTGKKDADIFVTKLNDTGGMIWTRQMGGPGVDAAADIVAGYNNDIYTTGSFGGTVDFDPGPGVKSVTGPGNNDIFISQLDTGGHYVWSGVMGSAKNDGGTGICTNRLGDLYTTGIFMDSMDMDPGPAVLQFTDPYRGYTTGYIHKLGYCLLDAAIDTVGGVLRALPVTATTYTWIDCSTLLPVSGAVLPVYNPVVSGSYAVVITDGSCTDTSDCVSVTVPVGIPEQAGALLPVLWPNPAGHTVTVNVPEVLSDARLQVISSLGQVMITKDHIYGKELSVDISSLATGIYYIRIVSDTQLIRVKQLVKK